MNDRLWWRWQIHLVCCIPYASTIKFALNVLYRRKAAFDKYFWRADCWGGISFGLKFDGRSGTNFKAFFGAEKTDTTIFESFRTWISRIGALFPKASLWIWKGKLTKNCFGWIQFYYVRAIGAKRYPLTSLDMISFDISDPHFPWAAKWITTVKTNLIFLQWSMPEL